MSSTIVSDSLALPINLANGSGFRQHSFCLTAEEQVVLAESADNPHLGLHVAHWEEAPLDSPLGSLKGWDIASLCGPIPQTTSIVEAFGFLSSNLWH